MKNVFAAFLFVFGSSLLIAQNLDIDILKKIHVNRNENLDNAFDITSHSITPVSIGVPLGVYIAGLAKHDSIIKNEAAMIGASLLVTTAITFGLKYAVHRPRPFATYPYIEKKAAAGSLSFPSGHTSNAFSVATSFSLAFPKWYVIAPSFLWASSVGYSRIHLGVHYPSDVLVGAIIGAGSSYLCYRVNKWLHNRKNSN